MKMRWIMLFLLIQACTPKQESKRGKQATPEAPAPSAATVFVPQGAWLATLGSNDECTLVYQFEDKQTLMTNLSCYSAAERSILRETRRYQLTPDDKANALRLTLMESSCKPARAAQLKSEQTLFSRQKAEQLELSRSQGFSNPLVLQQAGTWLDPTYDLRGTSYRGLPVKLGCFSDSRLTQFETQQI